MKYSITAESILALKSQFEIFEYYFKHPISLNTQYINPFRSDNNPSCYFKWNNNNSRLLFVDWAATQFNGDCFNLVKVIFNYRYFYEVLERINTDLKLGIGTGNIAKSTLPTINMNDKLFEEVNNSSNIIDDSLKNYAKLLNEYDKKVVFHIITKPYSDNELLYWQQLGVNKELLNEYNIHSTDKYYRLYGGNSKLSSSNLMYDNELAIKEHSNDYCFCYEFYDEYLRENVFKLYRPNTKNKMNKWKSNTSLNTIQGLNQLQNRINRNEYNDSTLFICSSLKDALCLISIGYEAIAPQSESSFPSEDILKYLKSKFKSIIIIFDNDNAGHKYSSKYYTQYQEYISGYFNFEYNQLKDIADIKLSLKDEFKSYFNNQFNTYKCQQMIL